MCHVPAAQRDNLYDEIWSDVIVARLPRVFQLWKQYKGKNDLDRYVMNNVSGYVYKYLIARSKRLANSQELIDDKELIQKVPDISDKELVQRILSGISKKHAAILFLKHCQGLTFNEIAKHLGLARTSAMYHHSEAIKAAKLLIKKRGLVVTDRNSTIIKLMKDGVSRKLKEME